MRQAAGFVGQVVTWAVILGIAGVLAVAVVVPRIAGATPYSVATGSMRPGLPPGTLVVVEPVDVGAIRVGDVVTYQIESGRPAVATHRVVAVSTTLDGEPRLTTRGDANDADDPDPVRPEQVKGRLWYSAPYLGHANDVLTGHQRQVALYVVVTGLLGYAAYMLTSAARDRRRSRTDTTEQLREEEPVR